MNKKEWFEKLIDLRDKKNKAHTSYINAKKRTLKTVDNYERFLDEVKPKSIKAGNYKFDGYLIEVDEYGIEVEVEPEYKKVK